MKHALLLAAALAFGSSLTGCDRILGIEELAYVAHDANVNATDANTVGVDADVAMPDALQVLQLATSFGRQHSCALLSDGSVRCWGSGVNGRLGYVNTNSIGDDEHPSSAGDVDVGGTVTQISANGDHTCALLSSGSVRCWGAGNLGKLGYGNTESIGDDESPSSAGDVDVSGTVTQISAGGQHTCALLSDGSVRCWGSANAGRLGYANLENIGDDEPPSSAGPVDVGGTVTQISAGGAHVCALLSSGSVRCWGAGNSAQLGYGNSDFIGDNELPSSAGDVDVGGTVTQIAAGFEHTCALLSTGNIRCWGAGGSGRLGYGHSNNIGDNELPSSAGDVNVGGTVTQIAIGIQHTCALLSSGSVRCWGLGEDGQLGYGNTDNIGDTESPSAAGDVDVGGTVIQISAGNNHSCALLSSGSVRCWGLDGTGQLGHGNTDEIGDNELPSSAGDLCIAGSESSCP